MTQVEAGQLEGKALGKVATLYAELMRGATILFHDTVKGIAKLQNQKVFDITDEICEEYYRILDDLDEKKNLKVRTAKLIATWAKMIAEPICFVEESSEFSEIEKYCSTVSIVGRFYETYRKLAYDYNIYDLLEDLNDYVDMSENLQAYHETYVAILNSGLREVSKNVQVFALAMEAIAEFFYKVESQVETA